MSEKKSGKLKVHFVPTRRFSRRAYKAECGKQFVEITCVAKLVTCERCKQSREYRLATGELI